MTVWKKGKKGERKTMVFGCVEIMSKKEIVYE